MVNIRADEIVDGNPKLTLGLIWTFILHFQVGQLCVRKDASLSDVSLTLASLIICVIVVYGNAENRAHKILI